MSVCLPISKICFLVSMKKAARLPSAIITAIQLVMESLAGVVVMFAEGEYLIPVTIVSMDDTQANVVPLNAGYLFEGMSVRLFKN